MTIDESMQFATDRSVSDRNVRCLCVQSEPAERPRSSSGSFSNAADRGEDDDDDDPLPQVWRRSGESCPDGTVPVRRTTEDDVLRASSSSATRFGMKARGGVFARRDSTGGGHEVSVSQSVTAAVTYGCRAGHHSNDLPLAMQETMHRKSRSGTNNCVIIWCVCVCVRSRA
jgi:hypothetical protein